MLRVYCLTGGHLKEFTDGESNFTALLQRAMEMEGVDRETLHQLICLLMKVSVLICSVPTTADSDHSRHRHLFHPCSHIFYLYRITTTLNLHLPSSEQ